MRFAASTVLAVALLAGCSQAPSGTDSPAGSSSPVALKTVVFDVPGMH